MIVFGPAHPPAGLMPNIQKQLAETTREECKVHEAIKAVNARWREEIGFEGN